MTTVIKEPVIFKTLEVHAEILADIEATYGRYQLYNRVKTKLEELERNLLDAFGEKS
jgi:hypothetical protein